MGILCNNCGALNPSGSVMCAYCGEILTGGNYFEDEEYNENEEYTD